MRRNYQVQFSDAVYLSLCLQIQNLGMFSVQDVLFRADIWAVSRQGNQLVKITECSIEQVREEMLK